MSAIHPNTVRTEVEFNWVWAIANPELFANRLKRFQEEHPITHWRHSLDMSLSGSVKVIANRRTTPFLDVAEYLHHQDGKLFLKETGQHD